MSESVEVSIHGKPLRLRASTRSEENYIREVANYVDGVMRELALHSSNLPHDRIALMAAFRIADTLFKQKQKVIEGINSVEDEVDRLIESCE